MAKRSRDDSVSSDSHQADDHGCATPNAEPTGNSTKYMSLDRRSETAAMHCLLPPHKPIEFSTYAEYELHYQQQHTNRCTECKRNLPSPHFLALHIAENHDPILASKHANGDKIYACFVEQCDKVCLEWKKRRRHLIDKHGYPKNYDFLIVDTGIDGRQSMLRPGVDADGHRKSSRERRSRDDIGQSTSAEVVDRPADSGQHNSHAVHRMKHEAASTEGVRAVPDAPSGKDDAVAQLTSSMSLLKMVPRSVKFGQGKGRTGFAKK